MNWPRIILDGLTMALVFNAVALLGFLVVPQAYSTMFPKDIKEAAAPYVEKKDVRIMKWILHPLYILLVLFWGISARMAGMTGFWPLFWAGYVEMTLVSVTDFIILDCILPQRITRHSGTRTDVDPGDVPPGGTVRGRHRPADRAVLLTDSEMQ